MSNYLPNHQKKQRICDKREAALRRLIVRGAERTKLINAALAVRDARIRAIRASFAWQPPFGAEENQRIASLIQSAEEVPLDAILAEFHVTE